MIKEIISKNEADTIKLGEKIGRQLKRGDVIALTGELGTGKTAFVKGVACGLGIEEYITSPTFTLVHSYKGTVGYLHHFDVYRISDEEELFEIGFEEYLYGGDICIIEWADLIPNTIPSHSVWIHFEHIANNTDKRRITLEGMEI